MSYEISISQDYNETRMTSDEPLWDMKSDVSSER